jgi:hypothetical protein
VHCVGCEGMEPRSYTLSLLLGASFLARLGFIPTPDDADSRGIPWRLVA